MLELAGEFVDPYTIASQLSLGMKAWITIGRAFLRNPKVLILDESSAALDFDSTERLFAKNERFEISRSSHFYSNTSNC